MLESEPLSLSMPEIDFQNSLLLKNPPTLSEMATPYADSPAADPNTRTPEIAKLDNEEELQRANQNHEKRQKLQGGSAINLLWT